MIADGVCFLMLERASYPARVAFSYLREIQTGFEHELRRDHGEECAPCPFPADAALRAWFLTRPFVTGGAKLLIPRRARTRSSNLVCAALQVVVAL